MDVSISPSLVAWFRELLEKKLFLESYTISHKHYLSRRAKTPYKRVDDLFEYKLFLESKNLTNDEVPSSKIIFKIIDSSIQEIKVYIIASKENLQYQDRLCARVKNGEIIVLNLCRIPLKEMYITSAGNISTTYDDVNIEGVVEKENGHTKEFQSLWGSPTYTEFLNSSWDRKWNKIWNLDYLEEDMLKFRHSIVQNLAGSLAYLTIRPTVRNSNITSKLYRFWCVFVVNFLANERITNVLYWSLVLLKIKRLKT